MNYGDATMLIDKALLALLCKVNAINHGQALIDWNAYVDEFNKTYSTAAALTSAQYFYNYNRRLIAQHNLRADRNQTTYRVAQNQFSDRRAVDFAALLPKAVYPSTSFESTPVQVADAPLSYDPRTNIGLTLTPEDQGTVCSSSWAYSVAKAVELMNALQTANLAPQSLSAQNLINCAGSGTGCTTQVPQMAFDYLTQYAETELVLQSEYPNNNTLAQQGMCTPPQATVTLQLTSYGRLTDGDDATLMRYVGNGIPVIVEFNFNKDAFGFMHYSSGIYQPQTAASLTKQSSQFLVVVGYGQDAATNLDFWLCLNSFGPQWGENGLIRILRSSTQPIANRAIFPNEIA
ncbi:zingipain-2 [Scaptodrosophila lebanonensis]|uniref:Zingipain-2 n=1 Tax=Drosophila lebanonensis TaxID=7225 RepID=A0A6J2ULE0_DROLE|nr:zingipain-2 [Scaptodrosophila lebanonensis]